MIAGLLHGIEDVAVLDEMPAPAAVADVDAGSRRVVDRTMPDRDARRHGDLHSRRLLLDQTNAANQTVLDEAVRRIAVGLRSGFLIDPLKALSLPIFKERTSHCQRITYESDGTRSGIADVATDDADSAVVLADEDRIAADLIELAIDEAAIFGPCQKHRAFASNRPIAA